jgi:hypothetical protein
MNRPVRRPSATRGSSLRPIAASSCRDRGTSSKGTSRCWVSITTSPEGVRPTPGWILIVWPRASAIPRTWRPEMIPVPAERAMSAWRWRT